MARTIRDTSLESRAARLKLEERRKPYYRLISQGCHIGYYKGSRGGSWIARYHLGSGKYKEKKLGLADDIQDANGVTVLSFAQAQEKARAWFNQAAADDPDGFPDYSTYTVKDACDEYMQWIKSHRKSYKSMRYSVDSLIVPELGHIKIAQLSTKRIRDWQEALSTKPPRKRSSKFEKQQYYEIEDPDDPDYLRKRKASANRILSVLKAALNKAYQDGKVPNDNAWRRVKPFRGVEHPKVRYLNRLEIQRLCNACPPDFRRLVQAAIYTGCRYGELTRMVVSDYNPDSKTLLVQESKSGKVRHVVLTDEAAEFFDDMVMGKDAGDHIFVRADQNAWGRSHQTRPLADACKAAKIKPSISFHILRHTHATQLAMQGVPMAVIATQLGHSDTRMVEKHYAHLAPSYVADTIRANFPKLDLHKKSNIRKIA